MKLKIELLSVPSVHMTVTIDDELNIIIDANGIDVKKQSVGEA